MNNFDCKYYLNKYPDLGKAGIKTYEQALNHYNRYGKSEGRYPNLNSSKILFVMGNGPSLKDVMDNPQYLQILKNNHTFGLNSAYRAYNKYNFWPTYFGCFDYVVNESHLEEFSRLVLDNNPIKKFFFIGNSSKKQNLYSNNIRNNSRFVKFNFNHVGIDQFNSISANFTNYINPGSSGANALQIGIMLGYKKIVLLGCDCNYVEKIDGAEFFNKNAKHQLQITKEISVNPNYWFNDYQQKGDKFNLPQTSKYQFKSWENISKTYPKNVKIINCSLKSKIPFFEKKRFIGAI